MKRITFRGTTECNPQRSCFRSKQRQRNIKGLWITCRVCTGVRSSEMQYIKWENAKGLSGFAGLKRSSDQETHMSMTTVIRLGVAQPLNESMDDSSYGSMASGETRIIGLGFRFLIGGKYIAGWKEVTAFGWDAASQDEDHTGDDYATRNGRKSIKTDASVSSPQLVPQHSRGSWFLLSNVTL